ncbi:MULTISPECIES: hypothetical protein [Agrobacterium]|nr:hypothetical protein [Agrobacterium deltaense]
MAAAIEQRNRMELRSFRAFLVRQRPARSGRTLRLSS